MGNGDQPSKNIPPGGNEPIKPADQIPVKDAVRETSAPEENLSPIAQAAVDNQAGTPPATAADKPKVDAVTADKQFLDIPPLPASTTGDGNREREAPKPQTQSVGDQLNAVPAVNDKYRDGRSDRIELTAKRAQLLPRDDNARALVLRELAETFENPTSSYAEKLAAAKALIELSKQPDGKVPDNLVSRDVFVKEQGTWKTEGSRGNAKQVWKASVLAHHEMQPLKKADVLKFLDNSAETIEKETNALKDAPADSPEMKQLLKKLATIFQTYDDDSPEKLQAAKSLKLIKGDGAQDEVLSIGLDIFHEAKTRPAGGRGGGTIVEKAAYTEHVPTTRKDVESYLAPRSERLLTDTTSSLAKPPDDAGRRNVITRATNVFLDSKNPEDKIAAAVSLLELGRGSAGNNGKADAELSSRVVHVAAETKQERVSHRGGGTKTVVVKEAYDRTDRISQKDAVDYLKSQIADSQPARGRLMAADALKRAGIITDVEHKKVLEGIRTDDKAPEAVKAVASKALGLDDIEKGLKRASDGRDTYEGPESVALDTTRGGQRDQLKDVLNRLALNPDMAQLLGEGQLEGLNKELDEGKFGPKTRDFYNKTAGFLSELSNGMAVGIVLRGGKLPVGLPIDVDRDSSGRAQGDDVFRAQLITGRVKVDIAEAKPGDKPDPAKMNDVANWTVKAASTINEMQLRFEVKAFDQAIEKYSHKGSLDKWKSTETMSVDDMRKLQAARGEWVNLAMQTENYAQAIAHFNKATQESVTDQKWPVIGDKIRIGDIEIDVQKVAGRDSNIFPDEALKDGVFPGTVKRVNGRITEMSFDLPATLDRSDENLAKMNKLKVWLEKYGPLVDQVTTEVSKGSLERGRLLLWGDIPEHEDKTDPITGKKYNFSRQRFDTETVKVKLPNGEMEDRIKVTTSIQKMYAGNLSYQDVVGDISEVGEPDRSGDVKVNGKFVQPGNADGVAINAKGEVQGEGGEYARVRVELDGRVMMRKVNQSHDLYVAGKRVEDTEWHEVFPDQKVSFGKPPTELGIEKNDAGKIMFNGQAVEPGTTVGVGRKGPIKVDDPSVGEEQAQVRVDALGRVYIKDNGGGSGTFVNGKPITDWTMIDPAADKVSFGKPGTNIDIDSKVRLYKPTDWVTVLLDNQMQVMPAANLGDWKSEAQKWHYGGKAAMFALDVGMLVTGTIELKAVQVAAKQAGKQAATSMLTRMMAQQGFKRGLWHVGLGATGLAHQSIENLGPAGKKFMELRGYAMMADIFVGSMVNPAVNLAKAGGSKVFGLAKPIEQGSHLNAYLKTAPIAKGLHEASGAMFFGMNFYFVPEIAAHQIPGIRRSLGQHNSETLLKSGALLRENEYKTTEGAPPPVTVEDLARRHTSPEGRNKITEAKAEAKEVARLPETNAKQKQEYLNKLAAQYIDSKTPEDKLSAAFGLLTYHAESSRSIPDLLATRTKEHLGLPENVTSSEVKAYIQSQIPRTLNLFDKQLQEKAGAKLDQVLQATDSGDPAAKKQLNDQLLNQFVTSRDDRDRVAAATALLLLHESGGKPANANDGAVALGTVSGADGQVQVKVDDVKRYLDQYHKQAVVASFDSYAANAKGNEKSEAIFRKTKEVLEKPTEDSSRQAQIAALETVYKSSTDASEKAAAGISLLFLSCDRSTGAFKPSVSQSGLKSDDIIADLKGSMSALPAGMRLSAGDFLYRTGETPHGGPSAFNDLGGVLLSVLNDKQASPELKKQALINAHGIGLSDVFEMHRFQTEPAIRSLEMKAAGKAEADLYGRDSAAMEKSLISIVSDTTADKDLRALASAVLLANSEPNGAKRAKLLTEIQTEYTQLKDKPGAYYDQLFKRNADTVKSAYDTKSGEFKFELSADDNKELMREALLLSRREGNTEALGDIKTRLEASMLEDKRSDVFRAALILSSAGNWKEAGVPDDVMAAAFHQAFLNPEENPLLARQAIDPLLKHYGSLSATRKDMFDDDVLALLREPHTNQDQLILRLETFGRLRDIEKVVGGTFGADARSLLSSTLTKGTPENLKASESIRAAAVIGLNQIGSNDKATRDLLTTIIGGNGDGADPSATVRSLALDRLLELKPPGFRDTALKLLGTETDREIIRKLGEVEFAERRLDPDSSEYRERYRQALKRMMESAAGKYSLTEVPGFINQNYKLLNFENYKQRVTDLAKAHYGGDFKLSFSGPDHKNTMKPFMDQADAEMNAQLQALVSDAQKPGGDMARRALTWIVMSNAKGFEAKHQDQVIKDAAYGLYKVCESGDAKAKEQVAPLLTMALATQDRMPYSARLNLLYGLTHLNPGGKDSPISKQDAGVAVLSALERQFHRTPQSGADPGYQDSHKLQTELLDIYKRYAGPEAIPILEAIAEEKFNFELSRTGAGLVEKVKYPDNSSRAAKYDENNTIWQITVTDKNGQKSTLVREGKSNKWYLESNRDRTKPDFEGRMEFNQETGSFSMIDAYKKETVYTTSGAAISRTDGKVNKVTYPDGSSRELLDLKYVYTNASGNKEIWNREPNSKTWYRDNDRSKTWTGDGRFDDASGDYIQQPVTGPTNRFRSDGGYVQFEGDKVIVSSPGAGDHSPHPMPIVREKAQALLAELRDSTAGLLQSADVDSSATPQKLNEDLKAVLKNPDANSEEVVKAIFKAGRSGSWEDVDPRRETLNELLNDPHERIQLAAARMLSASGRPQDIERVAHVLADIQKNGSRKGFRDDAKAIIDLALKDSARKEIFEAALTATPDRPRVYSNLRMSNDRPPEHQEVYEKTKGDLIRDTQITLDALHDKNWWVQNGYNLIHEESYLEAQFGAADDVSRNKITFWNKLGVIFSDGEGAKQKFKDSAEGVKIQRTEQFDKLLNDAEKGNENARKALAYIVLTNGFPLREDVRKASVDKAASKLALIYEAGGTGADYAEQIMQAALIANPGIERGIREKFADAVIKRLDSHASHNLRKSNAESAVLLMEALKAEQWAMPKQEEAGYSASINFQTKILNKLGEINLGVVTPELEAIVAGHGNTGVRDKAQAVLSKLRDETKHLLDDTVVDTTTDNQDKAAVLNEWVSKKQYAANDESIVRELFRLAHPSTFSGDEAEAKADPRIAVLKKALEHENDRVRLAAARILMTAVPSDPRTYIHLSTLRDSKRAGISKEARELYDTSWQKPRASLDAEGTSYLKELLKNPNERVLIAASSMLLAQDPKDAEATAHLARLYGSVGSDVLAEAKSVMTDINQRAPIEAGNDARREALTDLLKDKDERVGLAAAWMLSHSKAKSDYESATAHIARLAVRATGASTREDATKLLNEMIYAGGDYHQATAIAKWNDAWNQGTTQEKERQKPPALTDIDQARKHYRLTSQADRTQMFQLPENEKKAIIMHATGLSEAELEARIDPGPVADVLVEDPFRDRFGLFSRDSDPFGLLSPNQRSWDNPLGQPFRALRPRDIGFGGEPQAWNRPTSTGRAGDSQSFEIDLTGTRPASSYYDRTNRQGALPFYSDLKVSQGRPYQGAGADRLQLFRVEDAAQNPDMTKTSADQRRLWMAHMLSTQAKESKLGDVMIGRDGTFVLKMDGENKDRPLFLVPGDEANPFGQSEVPPEFSEFLTYMATEKPELMRQKSIKASELSAMFLQYLREREAGITSGFVLTPNLYDTSVEYLTSNPRAASWYQGRTPVLKLNTPGGNSAQTGGQAGAPVWKDFESDRQKKRVAKLDDELRRALETPRPERSGLEWKTSQAIEVAKPEFLAKPPVQSLRANQLAFSGILPQELLMPATPVVSGADGANPIRFTMDGSGRADTRGDIEIPTSKLTRYMLNVGDINGDIKSGPTVIVLRDLNGNTGKPQQFKPSPQAQRILDAYRFQRLTESMSSWNRFMEKGKGNK